jgi:hypothetical protein
MPEEHNRCVVYETCPAIPRNDMIEESLDWLTGAAICSITRRTVERKST